jgi:glycosyltransferase involved in cell wall biosynthesis
MSSQPAIKLTVSLVMIVRDEESNLPVCLASVHDLFDEIVVIDTGSQDRTRGIAASYGARVADFTWTDDFAAARNKSLAIATSDYVFWLDADDVVDAPEKEKLRILLKALSVDQKSAYVMRCVCDPDSTGDGGQIVVDHVRLFPRLPEVHWEFKVHEQILPSLQRAGVPTRWTDIAIRHRGYSDATVKNRKRQRDWDILQKEIAERPHDAFVLYNLGMIVFERQQWEEALSYFSLSSAHIVASKANEPLRRKLFAMIAWAHQLLGRSEKSLQVCEAGLLVDSGDAELLFRKAIALRYLRRADEAEACWKHILTQRLHAK